jgi:TadE-like protein
MHQANGSRKRRTRGNAILESALVFLPTMALLFAIIDSAMVIFIQNTFKHAVREGVRFAITERLLPGHSSQVDSIKAIVQQNAMGFLLGSAGLNKIDVRFYSPTTFTEATGAAANVGGNIVEVTISPCAAGDGSDCFKWGWMAPLQAGWSNSNAMTGRATSPMTIAARSADRLENPPGGIPPAL